MPKYRYAVMDIETTGLSRYNHEINYIGIALAEDIGAPLEKVFILNMHKIEDVNRFHRIVDLLKRDKVKLIWQNGKFDTLFIEHFAHTSGILLPIHYDVMLMGTAYDLSTKHGLDKMAEKYLGVENWDIPLKEKIKPNNPIVEEYLEKDLQYPWDLFCYFYDRLTPLQWKHIKYLLKPAFLMYRKTERKGIYFDKEKHEIVAKEYAKKARIRLKKLNEHYDINWNSPQQVSTALFKDEGLPVVKMTPTGNPSSDAKSLRRLAAQGYDLPNLLLDYKLYYGANSKFLTKWPEYAKHDGRIHPSFNVTNTMTGRPSCSEPNLQQVPRDPKLRTLFTAPKGRTLTEADYSQIELRVAADYADDKNMIRIYREGGDIHTETAMSVSGKSKPTKEDRTKAKPVNFGFLFGMQAKGFVDYAFDQYGVVFTRQEAERYRQLFFNKYSGLLTWHKQIQLSCEANGGVENRFGRFRALPDIYSNSWMLRGGAQRQSINTPVQSTASDLLVFSAIEVDRKLSKEFDINVVGTIHDALLYECPDRYVEQANIEVKKIMENPEALDIFGVSFKVPLVADITVGAWGLN